MYEVYLQAYESMSVETDEEVTHFGMMSHSVVLHCQQGSQIWLEVGSQYCFAGYPLVTAYKFNNFGGFAITEM